jgi:hypothetical protein
LLSVTALKGLGMLLLLLQGDIVLLPFPVKALYMLLLLFAAAAGEGAHMLALVL